MDIDLIDRVRIHFSRPAFLLTLPEYGWIVQGLCTLIFHLYRIYTSYGMLRDVNMPESTA